MSIPTTTAPQLSGHQADLLRWMSLREAWIAQAAARIAFVNRWMLPVILAYGIAVLTLSFLGSRLLSMTPLESYISLIAETYANILGVRLLFVVFDRSFARAVEDKVRFEQELRGLTRELLSSFGAEKRR